MKIRNIALSTVIAAVATIALVTPVFAAQKTHKATAASSHAKITAEQAKASALKKYHGKVVGKIVLENEEGKWQYAVNIRSGKVLHEVMVDANTGKVASAEVTSKAEEAKEAAAEAKAAKKKGGK